MKVVCVYESVYGGLTIGKWYEVIRDNGSSYWVCSDDGESFYYPYHRFETMYEFRDKKIEELLNG